jgi:hypothetical protein
LLDGIFGWRRTYEGNPLAVTFPMTLLDDASKPLSGVALKSGKNENLETDQGGTARLSFSWDSIPLEKSVWFPINVDLPAWEGLLHEQGDAVEYVPSRFSLFLKCVDGACALLGSDRSPERKFKYKVKTIHHHDDKLAREYQDRKEREAATEQEKLRQERVAAEQDKALKSVRDFTAPDQSLSFGEFIERQSQMALAATFQMFGTVIVQTAYARGINPGIRSPQWSAEYQSGAIYEIQCVLFDVYQKPSSKLIYVWDSEKGTFSGKDKESRGKLKEYTAP